MDANRPEGEKKRHARKYAEGEPRRVVHARRHLQKDHQILSAQVECVLRPAKIETFVLAELLHHLRGGEYSEWFRDAIKDDDLADEAREIEEKASLDAAATRAAIKEIVERKYTALAKG